jgi:alpha-galactosidase
LDDSIRRVPDRIVVVTDSDTRVLQHEAGVDRWWAGDVEVETTLSERVQTIRLTAPRDAIRRLHLRWRCSIPSGARVLGDHWERGYGDLEWRALVPERPLPWYVVMHDGGVSWGWGLEVGCGSVGAWRVDSSGISLWLDVRAGGVGVHLGSRTLHAATIVGVEASADETPFEVASDLCRRMCRSPLLPSRPVYGANDWYYAYGNNSHEQILDDARFIADCAPNDENRPFMVVDDGWQVSHSSGFNGGPWDRGNEKFPNMAALASEIQAMGVCPGLWIRPLYTRAEVPNAWRLAETQARRGVDVLDPSIPEVLQHVASDIRRITEWGYQLIKHDYSTFDISGLWGARMVNEIANDGWSFRRQDRTTAEIMRDLYRAIREAAGNVLILGCNTIGHLSAGLAEIQRTGDDTSGLNWERTRQRGVNTLAFRMPQHNAFFAADADCVGLTKNVDWSLNRQWLDLVARSGTPLFVSVAKDARGPDQKSALRDAFAMAAKPLAPAVPLDWMETTCPTKWRIDGHETRYEWFGDAGTAFSLHH